MSGHGNAKHRGNRRGNHKHNLPTLSSVARETALSLPADSQVLTTFKAAALILTDRQDRHERLVKLSRDITIESKRIIFLLHSAITNDSTENILKEANERFQKLINGPIKSIGLDLENSPAYLHSRAVTAGFQEYIEARTLYSLMASKEIIDYTSVQKEFTYTVTDDEEERTVVTMIPDVDYMLGIADLTGELMRRAINSISSGDSEECVFACQVVRDLFTGYLGVAGNRLLSRKLSTTRANVHKIERAVYALRVRGGETAPTLVLDKEWEPPALSDDEGYY